jgi:hypothetical protein
MLSFRNISLLVLNVVLCKNFFDFEQVKGEKLPESWARFGSLVIFVFIFILIFAVITRSRISRRGASESGFNLAYPN